MRRLQEAFAHIFEYFARHFVLQRFEFFLIQVSEDNIVFFLFFFLLFSFGRIDLGFLLFLGIFSLLLDGRFGFGLLLGRLSLRLLFVCFR